jgi:hypothetical protein
LPPAKKHYARSTGGDDQGATAVKWILALAVATSLAILLPWAIRASKRSARGKGRLGGAALAIGLAFGAMFDPAKSAAIETIQKKKEIGDEAEGAARAAGLIALGGWLAEHRPMLCVSIQSGAAFRYNR